MPPDRLPRWRGCDTRGGSVAGSTGSSTGLENGPRVGRRIPRITRVTVHGPTQAVWLPIRRTGAGARDSVNQSRSSRGSSGHPRIAISRRGKARVSDFNETMPWYVEELWDCDDLPQCPSPSHSSYCQAVVAER